MDSVQVSQRALWLEEENVMSQQETRIKDAKWCVRVRACVCACACVCVRERERFGWTERGS